MGKQQKWLMLLFILFLSTFQLSAVAQNNAQTKEQTNHNTVFASSVNIKGTVIDEYGEPVIGASVFVRDSKIGISTDYNGNFSLPNQCIDNLIYWLSTS